MVTVIHRPRGSANPEGRRDSAGGASAQRRSGGGGTTQQPSSSTPSQQIAQPTIPRQLRDTAKRVVGSIVRIERRNGQITFVGVSGRRFTPSSERLRRTGAITEREYQGRAGSGSVAAIARAVTAQRAFQQKVEKVRQAAQQIKSKSTKQKLLSHPALTAPILKTIKTKITPTIVRELTKEQKAVRKLEKDIRDIRELEKQAAKRSEKAADIFRVIPGLRGDNFAQKTARALLALPTRATVGLGEQVLISGLKLGITGKAYELGKKGVIDIKPVTQEMGTAAKQVPITIAKGYDPRTPEGLANIIATVALFKIAKGRGKVSTKAVKVASKNVARKALGLAKKQSGFKKAFNRQVAKDLSKLSRKPGFIRKTVIKANALRRAIPRAVKGKVKGVIAKRGSRFNVAREILRKQQANVKAIKIRRQQFKTTKIGLKKAKVSPVRTKQLLGKLKQEITNLQKTNKGFNTRLNKLGFRKSVRGKLRKSLKPEKVKIPKIKKIKIPKGKRIVKVRLKAKPRAAIKKATAPLRKIGRTTRRGLVKVLRKGEKLDLALRKSVNNSVNKIVRNFNRLNTIKKIGVRKTINAFNRIKNPTVKHVRLFARRTNRIVSKVGKAGVRITKKGVRAVKRPIKAGLRKGEKLDIALRKRVDGSINRLNKVTRKAGIKIRRAEALTAKGARKFLAAEQAIAKSTRLVGKILKKTGGKLTKTARRAIRSVEKKLPFKVKVVKTIPRRLKGLPRKRTGGRSPVRRAARKLSKADQIRYEARQILRGKKKLTSKTNPKVRKLVRKGRIIAAKKAQAGIRQSAARKARGVAAKLERAKDVTKKFKKAIQRKREEAYKQFDRDKSTRMVNKQRAERNAVIADKQIKQGQKLQNNIQKKVELSGNRQVLEQVVKQKKKLPATKIQKFKKAANKIKNGKSKAAVKKAFNQVRRDLFGLRKGLGKAAGKLPAVKGVLKGQVAVISGLGVLANAALAKSRFAPRRQAGIVAPTTKDKAKIKQIIKPIEEVKPIEKPKEKVIVIPDDRIDTLSQAKQAAIIASILGLTAGTQFIRRGGAILKPPMTLLQGGIKNRARYIFNKIKNRRFVFIPDIYSLIFGIRAKPKEKIALLKVGRTFTGAEIRKIV